MVDVKSFDLNLLIALKHLVEERNVTRAAEKLLISQPAMSHILRKLRTQLDDPILVKTATGMAPTLRAQALLEPTVAVLREIERIVQTQDAFSPATSRRRFVIATSDYVEFTLLPGLVRHIADTAPNVEIRVRQPVDRPPDAALEEEKLDVVIGFEAIFNVSPHLCAETLFEEQIVCVTGGDNKCAPDGKLSMQEFLGSRHMLISRRETGTGLIDDYLAARGLKRNVSVVAPNFLSAPWILEKTSLLLCLPSRVADEFAKRMAIRKFPLPFELPSYKLIMIWHPRQDRDPAHMWLRGALRDQCGVTTR